MQSDVTLIYPVWPSMGGKGSLQKMLPPLGILSIASYLEENGLTVSIIDLHTEKLSTEEFKDRVSELNPKFVGISILSAHVKVANNIASLCKEVLPNVSIIAGGVHAELYPEDILKNSAFSAVCIGDGEEVMLEYVTGKNLKDINGLVYYSKEREAVVRNQPRLLETRLDKYPFPAYHLIDLDLYFPAFSTYKRLPAMNLLMTRGCPGTCNFCNSARTTLRGRSPEKMVELIKILRYKYGILQFTFYDDTFSAHKKNLNRFCDLMIEQKVDATWVCYVRGDMFNDAIAEKISKAGCHHILLGIETGSSTLMEEMGKKIDVEQYRRVVRIAHKYSIDVRGAFIFGHLNETKETLKESLKFAIDLNIDFFQPSIMTPYPGTALYEQAKINNLLVHEEFELYGQNEVILKMNNISKKELLRFTRYAYFRFYFRPSIILKLLKRVSSTRHLKDLFHAIYIVLTDTVNKKDNQYLSHWLDDSSVVKKFRTFSRPRKEQTPLTFNIRQGRSLQDELE